MMSKIFHIQTLLTVLCVVFVSSFLHGAEDAAAQTDDTDKADHADLRELVGLYEKTIQEGKPELLKPYLADDFSGVMVTAEEVDSFASLDAYWQNIQGLLGKGGAYRLKVNVPQPAVIVGDLAYAHGTTDDVATTSAGKNIHLPVAGPPSAGKVKGAGKLFASMARWTPSPTRLWPLP